MIKAILFALLVAFALSTSGDPYTLALLPTERGAVCLDGTPVPLFHHAGSGANKNKYLVYFVGGGFCAGLTSAETIESCYKRSATTLGSSKDFPQTYDFTGHGLLSPDATQNPVFHDWTKVFMAYCDGSEYSGTLDSPIIYKDKKLYFRGYNNTVEQLRFMDEHFDFYNGDTIVITGVSAGGIATNLYTNYVKERSVKAKVYGMPDSGLFITEFYSPIVEKQVIKVEAENLFKLIHQEGDRGFPIKECFAEYSNDYYRCYNAANLAIYQKAPMFVIESVYDQWSIRNIIVTKCLSRQGKNAYALSDCDDQVREIIEEYRKATVNAFYQMQASRRNISLWSPACVQHGFSDDSTFTSTDYRVPSETGPTLAEAIQQFLDHPEKPQWHLDEVPWPYNSGCNGLAGYRKTPFYGNLLTE